MTLGMSREERRKRRMAGDRIAEVDNANAVLKQEADAEKAPTAPPAVEAQGGMAGSADEIEIKDRMRGGKMFQRIGEEAFKKKAATGMEGKVYDRQEVRSELIAGNSGDTVAERANYLRGLADSGAKFGGRAQDFLADKYGFSFTKANNQQSGDGKPAAQTPVEEAPMVMPDDKPERTGGRRPGMGTSVGSNKFNRSPVDNTFGDNATIYGNYTGGHQDFSINLNEDNSGGRDKFGAMKPKRSNMGSVLRYDALARNQDARADAEYNPASEAAKFTAMGTAGMSDRIAEYDRREQMGPILAGARADQAERRLFGDIDKYDITPFKFPNELPEVDPNLEGLYDKYAP